MPRFGRSYPVPRRGSVAALFAAPIVTGAGALNATFTATGAATEFSPASGTVTGSFTASSVVTTVDPTSGVVSSTFSAGFSPVAVSTSGAVTSVFTAAGAPVVQMPTAGAVSATFTASATAGIDMVATGVVAGNFAAGYAPEAIGVPSSLGATFQALFGPEAIGIPSGIVATFTVGYAPEGLGGSGVLSATFSAAPSFTVNLQTTGTVSGLFSVGIATAPKVSVPWNQSGNQYVPNLLSFGLHANYRVYVQVGVPTAQLGNNGDYCFRPDGTAGARMYVRSGGSWSAIN